MRFYFIVILCLSALSNYSQRINLNDTIINYGHIAGLTIGDSIDKIEQSNKEYNFKKDNIIKYGFDETGFGETVSRNNEILFYIWTKDTSKNILDGICILSDKFMTAKQVRVGMTIKDILAKDKDFFLTRVVIESHWLVKEAYYPIDLNIDRKITTFFRFNVPFNRDTGTYKNIGIYQTDDMMEKTKNIKFIKKKLSMINIYK